MAIVGNVRCGEFIIDVTDHIMAQTTLLAAPQTITVGLINPPWPQLVVVRGFMTGPALTGNVTVNGTDVADAPLAEIIALNNNDRVVGGQIFKTVTSVDLPARVTVGDQVSVGPDIAPHQLPDLCCGEAFIKALDSNSDPVFVCGSPTALGYELQPQEAIDVEVPDLHQLWLAGTHGEGITYLALA